MKKIILVVTVSLMALSVVGCSGGVTKQDLGTAAGAVAGGAIGSQFGGAVPTIGGAVVGGYIGNELTKN